MALQFGAEGVDRRVEGHGGQRVVRFASEVEAVDEEVFDVLGPSVMPQAAHSSSMSSGSAGRRMKPALDWRARRERTGRSIRPSASRSTSGRIEVAAQGTEIALLPVADEVAIERGRPCHPAFEEGEIHLRESSGDAAQEEGLGQ